MTVLADFVARLVGDECDACGRSTRVLFGVRPLSPALCSRCWALARREARA